MVALRMVVEHETQNSFALFVSSKKRLVFQAVSLIDAGVYLLATLHFAKFSNIAVSKQNERHILYYYYCYIILQQCHVLAVLCTKFLK